MAADGLERGAAPVEIAVVAADGSARAVIPSIGAWNVGYLSLCEQ